MLRSGFSVKTVVADGDIMNARSCRSPAGTVGGVGLLPTSMSLDNGGVVVLSPPSPGFSISQFCELLFRFECRYCKMTTIM